MTNFVDELLNESTPLEKKMIENRMIIAVKIAMGISAKNWNKSDLMKSLDMTNQSMITRWLSGTHNFTSDTLTRIGFVLDIKLLDTDIESRPSINIGLGSFQGYALERELPEVIDRGFSFDGEYTLKLIG